MLRVRPQKVSARVSTNRLSQHVHCVLPIASLPGGDRAVCLGAAGHFRGSRSAGQEEHWDALDAEDGRVRGPDLAA